MAVTTPPITIKKLALVVDDSKLARYVLKEMLVNLGLKVETAQSAEEALGSLSALTPDVIFMDHMMPGMDGLQAVQAIKSDPKTATIPILMYTSKDEGVYVNQARAFGAVGVLPKKLKQMQLEKVLVQLKLIASSETAELTTPETVSAFETDQQPIFEHVEAPAFKPSKASAFEDVETPVFKSSEEITIEPIVAVHSIDEIETRASGSQNTIEELARSACEEQEKDSMRLLFRQLFLEQRDSIKKDQLQLVAAMADQVKPIVLKARQKMGGWQIFALSGLFLSLMASFALVYSLMSDGHYQQEVQQRQIMEQNDVLLRLEQTIQNLELNQGNVSPSSAKELNVKPIEWAINHNSQLSYQQQLNTIGVKSYIAQLITQLDDFEFMGSLYIQFHSGDFCQTAKDNGQQVLLSPEKSVSQCQFNLKQINNAEVLSEFETFLDNLGMSFPNIKVIFDPVGSEFVLQDYPDLSEDITAGEWNAIAKRNNRFDFVLVDER